MYAGVQGASHPRDSRLTVRAALVVSGKEVECNSDDGTCQIIESIRRKDGADRRDDDDAMMWMKAAGQRLMSMLHWLKTRSPSEVNAGD